MLSATVASNHLFFSPRLSSQTLPVSAVPVWKSGGRDQRKISAVSVSPLGFLDARPRRRFVRDSRWDKIVRHGGWMASGWDLEVDESEQGDEVLETESGDQEESPEEVFCPASSLGSSL